MDRRSLQVSKQDLHFFTKVEAFVNVISTVKCGIGMSISHAVGGMASLEEAVAFEKQDLWLSCGVSRWAVGQEVRCFRGVMCSEFPDSSCISL
jgi:hypothetical protein